MLEGKIVTRIPALQTRLRALYTRGNSRIIDDPVLAQAFEDLEYAMEMLQNVETQLRTLQSEAMNQLGMQEQQTHDYYELFFEAPTAYVITGLKGTIQRANRQASLLFATDIRAMQGRPLTLFVPKGERRHLQHRMAAVTETQQLQCWPQIISGSAKSERQMMVQVAVARGPAGRPQALRWVFQESLEGADSSEN